MKTKLTLAVLAFGFACSVQAISFRDYYRAHTREVDAAVGLRALYIPDKGLTDLDGLDTVPNIGQLQELFLKGNKLEAIPESIGALTQLQTLNLTSNRLKTIPESIGNLVQLQALFLWANQLTTVPDSIGNLIHLRTLQLSHNRLAAIPGSIGNLTQLRDLYLNDNQLAVIPASIGNLNHLESLAIYNNPIPVPSEQLRMQLHLRGNVKFRFKTLAQQQAEHDLFSAIRNPDATTIERIILGIRTNKIRGPLNHSIDIAKISDAKGNNLLHAAIQDASKHFQSIQNKSGKVQGTEEEKRAAYAKLERQAASINASYIKVFSAILSCGDECVQGMLRTTDAQGDQVVKAILARLGPKSPILLKFKELAGMHAPEVKAEAKEEEKEEQKTSTSRCKQFQCSIM